MGESTKYIFSFSSYSIYFLPVTVQDDLKNHALFNIQFMPNFDRSCRNISWIYEAYQISEL